jgi:uncharacterized protein with gpF-like domain
MKHQQWQPKKRIESDYQRAIQRLIDGFHRAVEEMHIIDPYELMRQFKLYCQNGDFMAYVRSAASHMITGLAAMNARTWRQAAAEGMQSGMIHRSLQHELEGPVGQRVRELVAENAALISSLPDDVAASVNRFIEEETMHGRRASVTARELESRSDIEQVRERFSELTRNRIALIARTETSKASTALTRARAEELELPWYVWRTSKDGRVRPSHRLMDRVLVAWGDPPAPELLAGVKSTLGQYDAGNCPNCRCYPEPVIKLDRIVWPAKVYRSNSIGYMTRSAFEELISPRMAAAA